MNFIPKYISFVMVSLLLSWPLIAMMEDDHSSLSPNTVLIPKKGMLAVHLGWGDTEDRQWNEYSEKEVLTIKRDIYIDFGNARPVLKTYKWQNSTFGGQTPQLASYDNENIDVIQESSLLTKMRDLLSRRATTDHTYGKIQFDNLSDNNHIELMNRVLSALKSDGLLNDFKEKLYCSTSPNLQNDEQIRNTADTVIENIEKGL